MRKGFFKKAMKQVGVVGVFHNGKILMGKRKDNQKWTTPGGHLEGDENPSNGAARELEEEAGIKLDPSKLDHVTTKDVKKPDGEELKIHAFKVDLKEKPSTSVKNDPDDEVYRWQWFDINSIPTPLHVDKENVMFDALNIKYVSNGFKKQASRAAATTGGVLFGPIGAALGSDEGKREKTFVNSLIGGGAGGILGHLAGGRKWSGLGSVAGSGLGAYIGHGKGKEKNKKN